MKAELTEITSLLNSPLAILHKKGTSFTSNYHSHPEIELVYILSGKGKRLVGDQIENFMEGEIALIGSDLPHKWMYEDIIKHPRVLPSSIVIYFNQKIFADSFYTLWECQKLKELFSNSKRGIIITGDTRRLVAKKMERLFQKKGLEKIIGLLDILNIIANSTNLEFILKSQHHSVETSGIDRLTPVYKYIQENFRKDIKLAEISKIANLSPTAFCRLFKQKTQLHFIEYLTEVRIANACELLLKADLHINSISEMAGFRTLSAFTKSFKKYRQVSPKEYRKTYIAGINKVA